MDADSWYADVDGDGFGAGEATLSCEGSPDGFVSNADDCDDESAEINPDGVEECDGVDENCNGVLDDLPQTLKIHSLRCTSTMMGMVSETSTRCSMPVILRMV